MQDTMPIILISGLATFLVIGCLVLAFGNTGGIGGKARRKRLSRMRERFSASDEARTEAQMKKILMRQDNKLDSFIDGFIPRPDEMRMRLLRTGKAISLGKYGMICGGVALGIAVLGALLKPALILIFILLGLLMGILIPHMAIGMMIKGRQRKFITLFPDAIDLMVRGLRSGLPITESLGIVSREIPDPVSTEFRMITDRIKIGQTMEQALNEAASRINVPEFKFYMITLSIQRETGGNLAETLSNLSDILRKRQQLKLKIKAMSSEAKASAWIIGLLPFIMFLMLNLINPVYMGKFWVDMRLQLVAGGGLLWLSLGVFIMSRMIAFEV